jgi:hypothetical protein
MSKSFKIVLVVLAVVVAGIAAYFLSSSEAWQGAMRRIRVPLGRSRVPVVERVVRDKIEEARTPDIRSLNFYSAQEIDESFEELLGNSLLSPLSGNDEYSQEVFYEALLTHLEELKSNSPTYSFPDDYIFTFLMTPKVTLVDDEALDLEDPNTWKLASAYGACAIGDEIQNVNALSFQSKGVGSFYMTFQGFYQTYNQQSNEFDTRLMWPEPFTSTTSWPGDINLAEPFILDPNSSTPCGVFGIFYNEINNSSTGVEPLYEQFSLRGMRDQEAGDLDLYYQYDNAVNIHHLYKLGQKGLLGTINIFNFVKIGLFSYHAAISSQTEVVNMGSSSADMGTRTLTTFPNSAIHVDSLDLKLESDFGEDYSVETKVTLRVKSDTTYYNSYYSTGTGSFHVLHEGINTIPVNLDIGPGHKLQVAVDGVQNFDETGELQVSIVGGVTDGELYQGNCLGYYSNLCGSILDEVNFALVQVVDPGDVSEDSNVKFHSDIFPKWVSEDDLTQSSVGFDGSQVFSLNFHNDGVGPPVQVGPIDVEVAGSFEEPLNLIMSGTDSNAVSPSFENLGDYEVLPGDIITIDSFELDGDGVYKFAFVATNMPADSLSSPKYLRFIVTDVPVTYSENGSSVVAGDAVPLYYYPYDDLFQGPFISKKVFFGVELMLAWQGSIMSPLQNVFLANTGFNMFTVNESKLQSQGDLKIYEVTYQHMHAPEPPFSDIVLETDKNEIYYNSAIPIENSIVKWEDDYVTFTFTNPEKMDHSNINNLKLKVFKPDQEVFGAWFKLYEVIAKKDNGEEVPIYAELIPEQVLLEEDPVTGTVYNFLCDYFNEDGECLY